MLVTIKRMKGNFYLRAFWLNIGDVKAMYTTSPFGSCLSVKHPSRSCRTRRCSIVKQFACKKMHFLNVKFEKVKWTCWARLRSFRDYWPTVVEEIGCRLVGSFDAVGKRETV